MLLTSTDIKEDKAFKTINMDLYTYMDINLEIFVCVSHQHNRLETIGLKTILKPNLLVANKQLVHLKKTISDEAKLHFFDYLNNS